MIGKLHPRVHSPIHESPHGVEGGLTAPAAPVIALGSWFAAGKTITWPSVPGATSYQAYRDGVLIGTVASPYTIASQDCIAGAITVRATNGAGQSADSNALASATTVGVPFKSGVYANTVGTVNHPILYILVRERLDALPKNSDSCYSGTEALGAAGGGFVSTIQKGNVGAVGKLNAFSGQYSDDRVHIPTPGEIGRYQVRQTILDLSTGKVRDYIDGEEMGGGGTTANVSFLNGKASLNTRAGFAGTFQPNAWTFIEMRFSTVAPSAAQRRADAIALPGTALAAGGETNAWLGSASGAAGVVATSIPDSIGGQALVITGTPDANATLSTRCVPGQGTWRLFGDSITAGRVISGRGSNGYRQTIQLNVVAAGSHVALTGDHSNTSNSDTTLDYDYYGSDVGGQALGIHNTAATVDSRLEDIAADTGACGPDERGIMLYGANDYAIRVINNGDSGAVAKGHLITDLGTFLTTWRTKTSGRLHIVCTLRETLAAAGDQRILDAIAAQEAAFVADIATLNGTYAAVTGRSFGAAFDPATMTIDGLHPSPTADTTLIGPQFATDVMS